MPHRSVDYFFFSVSICFTAVSKFTKVHTYSDAVSLMLINVEHRCNRISSRLAISCDARRFLGCIDIKNID